MQRIPCRAAPRPQRAFTLFELLLVVAIVGILAGIAYPSYERYMDKVRVEQVRVDIRIIEGAIERYRSQNNADLPASLAAAGVAGMRDPWGNPYQYLGFTPATRDSDKRKDGKLHPLNDDYDLYSMGKDGESRLPLTARASRDDIVRANSGQFVGLASDY